MEERKFSNVINLTKPRYFMESDSWVREYTPGRKPEKEYIEKAIERIRERLPDSYEISEEIETEDRGPGLLEETRKPEYEIFDHEGEMLGDLWFNEFPRLGKSDWFSAHVEGEGESFHRVRRALDEVDQMIKESNEFEVDAEEPAALIHYEGRRRTTIYDEQEVEEFQGLVENLEDSDGYRIDPRTHDRDLFYQTDWNLESTIQIIAEDYNELQEEIEDTPLEWGGKVKMDPEIVKINGKTE